MTLPMAEFIGRYLRHVPAPGTRVVRTYGLYAPTHGEALAVARGLLEQGPMAALVILDWQTACSQRGADHPERCPVCGRLLVCSGVIPRASGPPAVVVRGESVACTASAAEARAGQWGGVSCCVCAAVWRPLRRVLKASHTPIMRHSWGCAGRSPRREGRFPGNQARYKLHSHDVRDSVRGSSNHALKRTAAGSEVGLSIGCAAA